MTNAEDEAIVTTGQAAAMTEDQLVTTMHCGQEFAAEREGGHRLLSGDATNADDVARLAAGAQAHLCFTSPPYSPQRNYDGGIGDWDALMQGVFSILPVKHASVLLLRHPKKGKCPFV